MQINAGPMIIISVSVRPYEPRIVYSVGHLLLVSSILSDYYNLSFSSSVEFVDLQGEGFNGDL